MFSFFKKALISSLAAASIVRAYADPEPCSGACWAHDPALIQRSSDGVYFKFNTGGGMEIVTSNSLTGPWTIQGEVLPNGSIIQQAGNTDLWAPDVTKVGDQYHLYYSISQFGTQESAIGLATSSSMDPGSWTDRGSVGVSSSSGQPYNAIDANLLAAGGNYYLNFGSFFGDIFQVQLNAAATNKDANNPYNIEFNSTGTRPSEGSYVFFKDGFYYLLWSSGICCGYDTTLPAQGEEYKIMMCRSTSPTGGFVDQSGRSCTADGGSILLASHGTIYGPGGQGVFSDPNHGLIMYYHYANTSVGYGDGQYLFGWNTLGWNAGWPFL